MSAREVPPCEPMLLGAVRADHVDAERCARIAWAIVTEPGDGVAGALVAELGAVAALEAITAREPAPALMNHREVGEGLRRWRPRATRRALNEALELTDRAGLRVIIPGDVAWPDGLDDLENHAPFCLWRRGASADSALGADGRGLECSRSVAIVGARAATAYGEYVAADLAAGAGRRGLTVVSGAAYGIDGAAHRASLGTGAPTVAFLAGGADRSYPAGHAAMIERIAASGAVYSEVPPGSAPTKWRFLARNRLIAASSAATVVVEAGSRSGSLNTAAHAATLGRALGAVPGPVTSAASLGCHRLLREGAAICITSPDDVAELVGGESSDAGPVRKSSGATASSPGLAERTDDASRVHDALSTRAARSVEEIARRAGMTRASVEQRLGLLELEGEATRDDAGWRAVPTRR